jgi:tRNA-dihydrouridine synthase B
VKPSQPQQFSNAPQQNRLAPAFVAPYCAMMQPIRLGPLVLETPVLLAPMAGVTDTPFRRQARAFGAPYSVSEMVASEHLVSARADMVRRAAGGDGVGPLAIQIAGREPKWMALAAKLCADAGAAVIDINMGCPCKRVTNGLAGSALMQDPDLALTLIDATVKASPTPVTLKMRLGWDMTSQNAPEIAVRAQNAGVHMIVIHGRTRVQFYNGQADWRAIRATVEAVHIPVIANGDIQGFSSARTALAQSGAAGVMIGRAANGAPWAAGRLAQGLKLGAPATMPCGNAIRESLLALYDDSLNFYGAGLGAKVARKHIAWAIDAAEALGPPEARKALRGRICRMEDPNQVKRALRQLDFHSVKVAA